MIHDMTDPGCGAPVHFDGSRMPFRGPAVSLDRGYVLCLGGSETYGKFVADPFPRLLARRMGVPILNMGAMNAGLDFLITDAAVARAIDGAEAVVLQVPGAANLTNRYYSVHPCRNDRFVRASGALMRLLPGLEVTDIHYTRHLLSRLQTLSTPAFQRVVQALRDRWRDRMGLLLDRIAPPVHLLWASSRPADGWVPARDLVADPLFVTPPMLAAMRPRVATMTEVATPPRRSVARWRPALGAADQAARALPGAAFHLRTASALLPHLSSAR